MNFDFQGRGEVIDELLEMQRDSSLLKVCDRLSGAHGTDGTAVWKDLEAATLGNVA